MCDLKLLSVIVGLYIPIPNLFLQHPPPYRTLNINPHDCIFCLKLYPDPLINTPLVYEIFLKCGLLPAIRLPLQLAAKEYNVFYNERNTKL